MQKTHISPTAYFLAGEVVREDFSGRFFAERIISADVYWFGDNAKLICGSTLIASGQ